MDPCLPELAATRLLLTQRLHSLRFDITRLQYGQTVVFDSVQHFCAATRATLHELSESSDLRDGLTLVSQRDGRTVYIVLYNENVSSLRRRRFTLAHEIGHILLGHMDDDDPQEKAADAFAAQLLLPRILVEHLAELWEGSLEAADLCELFDVSYDAAVRRMDSLRDPVTYTDEDYALLKRFCGLLPSPHEPLVNV